jgi:putative sigma-54 modulation protein
MHIHLSPRHLKLTSALHSYVADKMEHLEVLSDEMLAAHVVLIHDETAKPARSHCVKVHIAVPGPDVHAEQYDADLYAAIDKVIDKAGMQLRKRKTKRGLGERHKVRRTNESRKKFG